MFCKFAWKLELKCLVAGCDIAVNYMLKTRYLKPAVRQSEWYNKQGDIY